jgi:hypothetical protein
LAEIYFCQVWAIDPLILRKSINFRPLYSNGKALESISDKLDNFPFLWITATTSATPMLALEEVAPKATKATDNG